MSDPRAPARHTRSPGFPSGGPASPATRRRVSPASQRPLIAASPLAAIMDRRRSALTDYGCGCDCGNPSLSLVLR